MPRNSRIFFEGAIYHIYQRGNNKEYIFENPKHKNFFIKQIKEYNKKFDFELLAYVIMDNHYHLLMKTNKDSIDKIMFNINNVLGKYLNRKLNRTGHVFENRYKSKLVETDTYLLWLLRYIHRNPIRAHMCNNIDESHWSSHFFYKYGISCFVNTDFILNTISPNKANAIKQYLILVNIPEEQNNPKIDYDNIKQSLYLANESLLSKEITIVKPTQKSLDDILYSLNLDIPSRDLLKSGSQKRHLIPYKLKFIKVALDNKYTLKEIGTFLNISLSAVSKFISYHNIPTNL